MATTPTYSWPIPDNTDLVKDGAEAIRDLGNAIDTTVDGLPGAGLVHINTTSFSAVASQSINDVFTSTYDKYLVIFDMISVGGTLDIRLRLRASGSDITGANYRVQRLTGEGSTPSAQLVTGQTSIIVQAGITVGTRLYNTYEFKNPNLAEPTAISNFQIGPTGDYINLQGGVYNDNALVDGFSFFTSANSITGSVSTFGYRKS
jgi:hypothetical protein